MTSRGTQTPCLAQWEQWVYVCLH